MRVGACECIKLCVSCKGVRVCSVCLVGRMWVVSVGSAALGTVTVKISFAQVYNSCSSNCIVGQLCVGCMTKSPC